MLWNSEDVCGQVGVFDVQLVQLRHQTLTYALIMRIFVFYMTVLQ